MQGRSLFRRSMVAAGLLIVIALCAVAFAQTGNSGQLLRTSAPASTPPPVYQRWLNEDVAYIITPEERAEFLKVQTADGRDQFIVQFWLRRDPTPNTPENEFKEEHYRRIAFANVHFADSQPGWKTDCGRIYIVYGPPDEIKTETNRLANGVGLRAFEWHYRSVSGHPADFQFVDSCQCGRYQLMTPTSH